MISSVSGNIRPICLFGSEVNQESVIKCVQVKASLHTLMLTHAGVEYVKLRFKKNGEEMHLAF